MKSKGLHTPFGLTYAPMGNTHFSERDYRIDEIELIGAPQPG
jgi:hypothetical protein